MRAQQGPVRQRPYSIRTRIKTSRDFILTSILPVRDHIPLEQGLRHALRDLNREQNAVRDHIPLEQGLRLKAAVMSLPPQCRQRPYSIRTRIKTGAVCQSDYSGSVRDHIPLEQGLRHIAAGDTVTFSVSETIFH